MTKQIRRVVTGHNAQGKSIIVSDGPPPGPFSGGTAGVVATDLWKTHATPASNAGNAEAIDPGFRLPPPKNGSIFRIVAYPPDAQRFAALASRNVALEQASGMEAARDKSNPRHVGFHKTDTIDYAIVLSGEIVAMMDQGETVLKAGDVLVQRGTNHAWSNRTNETTYVAFVLIDAEPAP